MESNLKIQEGVEASWNYAEETGKEEDGPRGCADSEGVGFQKEHEISK
jgi:hypothetical protein